MKKILIFILIFLNIKFLFPNQNIQNELIPRTIIFLPFNNINKYDEYNYLASVIRNTLIVQINKNLKVKFIENKITDEVIKITIDKDDKIKIKKSMIKEAIELGADIFVYGNYRIIDEKIIIESICLDLLTGEIVTILTKNGSVGVELLSLIDELAEDISKEMSEKLTLIRKSYYEDKRKELESRLKKEIKQEEKLEKILNNKKASGKKIKNNDLNDLKHSYEISIGIGIFPIGYQYKDSNTLRKYEGNVDSTNEIELELNWNPIDKFFWGITIPFSFSCYLNRFFSLGFLFSIGYMPGFFYDYINEESYFEFRYANTLQANLAIKNRFGKYSNKAKLLLEYGVLLNLEPIGKQFDYWVPRNSLGRLYWETHGIFFISLGPKISIGLEILNKKNFSMELLAFSAVSFGWQSFFANDFENGRNIDIQGGCEIRLNYKYIKNY